MKLMKKIFLIFIMSFIFMSAFFHSVLNAATPAITSPTPGSTLAGSTVTFSWSDNGTSVSEWWLYVGTSLGGWEIHDSGSLGSSTSTTVSGLPTNGSTVYVRLWYKTGGSWESVDSQYATGGGGMVSITTSKSTYTTSESIVVNWSNGPGYSLDWIGLSEQGSSSHDYIDWTYIGGATSGSHSFSSLPAGNYEARFYLDNGYTILDTDLFEVTGGGGMVSITTSKSTYTTSESIVVNWSNGPGYSLDWIGLSEQGSSSHDYIDWTYIGGATSGSHGFSSLPAGNYEARFYLDDGYTILDTALFEVTGTIGTPWITSPEPGSTLSGSKVTFSWSDNGTSVSEWWLYVGKSLGGSEIHNSGSLGSSTSTTVNGLPTDGSTVYVRLWWLKNGLVWLYLDFKYTAYIEGTDHPDKCENAADIWPYCVWDKTNGYYECTIQGSIGIAGDVDWFELKATTWGQMVAYTTGITDTFGAVYRAPCGSAVVAKDDDSGSGNNFAIGPVAATGGETLLLEVSHHSFFGSGKYTLIFIWDPWL